MSIIRQWIYRGGHYSYRGKSLVHMYVCVCRFLYMLCMCMWEREQERVRAGWTAALIWFCLLSTQSRNVSRGNTWRVGKMGEEVVVVSALPLALYQAYMDAQTHTHTHTPHMCEGSLGSQSAALNKAFLFLPLIAGSICHWGVQFLISALTERGEVGKNTKWMHLLTNEIKPLHLHFPPFPPAGTMLPCFSSRHIELFPTNWSYFPPLTS